MSTVEGGEVQTARTFSLRNCTISVCILVIGIAGMSVMFTVSIARTTALDEMDSLIKSKESALRSEEAHELELRLRINMQIVMQALRDDVLQELKILETAVSQIGKFYQRNQHNISLDLREFTTELWASILSSNGTATTVLGISVGQYWNVASLSQETVFLMSSETDPSLGSIVRSRQWLSDPTLGTTKHLQIKPSNSSIINYAQQYQPTDSIWSPPCISASAFGMFYMKNIAHQDTGNLVGTVFGSMKFDDFSDILRDIRSKFEGEARALIVTDQGFVIGCSHGTCSHTRKTRDTLTEQVLNATVSSHYSDTSDLITREFLTIFYKNPNAFISTAASSSLMNIKVSNVSLVYVLDRLLSQRMNETSLKFYTIVFIDLLYATKDFDSAVKESSKLQIEATNRVKDEVEFSITILHIALSGFAVLMATGIAVMVTKFVAQIKELEQGIQKASEMQLVQQTTITSGIQDIVNLNNAFMTLQSRLQDFRSFVPACLLGDCEDSDNEIEPPSGEVTILCTDIQGSTSLWSRSAPGMNAAMEIHNEIQRKHIRAFDGYEVKTIGDSFVVAFRDEFDALECCMAVQHEMRQTEWPGELLLTDDGLLLRMGLHCSTDITSEINTFTTRTDYKGKGVDIAVKCESLALGGTICMTTVFFDRVRTLIKNPTSAISHLPFGNHTVTEGDSSITLYIAVPEYLSERLNRETEMKELEIPHTKRHPSGNCSVVSNSIAQSSNVTKKNCTMGIVNVTFLSIEDHLSDPCSVYCRFLRTVIEMLKPCSGSLMGLHGTYIITSFNLMTSCNGHFGKSVHFCNGLEESRSSFGEISFSVGIAMGMSMIGDAGSDRSRYPLTPGFVSRTAPYAAAFAAEQGFKSVVMTCSVLSEAGSQYLIPIDQWLHDNRGFHVYELQSIKNKSSRAPILEYKLAYTSMATGDFLPLGNLIALYPSDPALIYLTRYSRLSSNCTRKNSFLPSMKFITKADNEQPESRFTLPGHPPPQPPIESIPGMEVESEYSLSE